MGASPFHDDAVPPRAHPAKLRDGFRGIPHTDPPPSRSAAPFKFRELSAAVPILSALPHPREPGGPARAAIGLLPLSNSQVSGPSSEEPGTAPFVREQQSRAALLLVAQTRRATSGEPGARIVYLSGSDGRRVRRWRCATAVRLGAAWMITPAANRFVVCVGPLCWSMLLRLSMRPRLHGHSSPELPAALSPSQVDLAVACEGGVGDRGLRRPTQLAPTSMPSRRRSLSFDEPRSTWRGHAMRATRPFATPRDWAKRSISLAERRTCRSRRLSGPCSECRSPRSPVTTGLAPELGAFGSAGTTGRLVPVIASPQVGACMRL